MQSRIKDAAWSRATARSAPGRRPQYAWFFGGDGLIAIEALVNTGAYDRARDALAFIAKYQDAATGMIWHELSQSADPADWASRYPTRLSMSTLPSTI